MTNVFLDSDVILDVFFDRKPFSESASILIDLCERNKIKGYITPIIISNIYYLLRKSYQHDKVIEKLKILISFIDILIVDKQIISNALNSNFNDFEDALQNYSSESNNKIDIIITRNVKDYKNSKLGIMTPNDFIKSKLY